MGQQSSHGAAGHFLAQQYGLTAVINDGLLYSIVRNPSRWQPIATAAWPASHSGVSRGPSADQAQPSLQKHVESFFPNSVTFLTRNFTYDIILDWTARLEMISVQSRGSRVNHRYNSVTHHFCTVLRPILELSFSQLRLLKLGGGQLL